MSETLSSARAKSKRERTRDGLVAAAETLFAARGPDSSAMIRASLGAGA